MRKIIYIFILGIIASACTSDFEEINTNPNAPTKGNPELLLRQVIYDYGEQMSYEGFVAGNLLSQHFTMIDFNLFDRHDLSSPQLGGNPWPVLYTNLRNNEIILNLSRESAINRVYEGPALILKAYMTAALTDIYGDVPYNQALQGQSGITTPEYDTQEVIYTSENGILDNLDKAIVAIEAYQGTQVLKGDILFDGDLEAWIKFANSLKIKSLLRISDQKDVSVELNAVVASGDYLTTNDENATFDFSDTQPNTFRMAVLRAGDFNLFVMSETIQEIMSNYDDPRLQVLFRPSGNANTFAGLLNGPDASQVSSVGDFSLAGTIFRENTGVIDANFITAWETKFLLAEAAQRNLITANAQLLYEEGVQLAFDYWNTTMPDDYLTTGQAAFNNGDPMNQIITQKWIANIINGYEGWIEYRRTGFPELKAISASLNNNLIPVKMPYPADETVLNAANFDKATGANGNSVDIKVWWQVN